MPAYCTFLICAMIALVFVNKNVGSATTLDVLPDSVLKEQILHIACKNKCFANNNTMGMCDCNSTITQIDIQSLTVFNKTLEILCKEADKVVLKTCNTNNEENVFLIEVQTTNEKSWTFLNLTKSCFLIADKLISSQEYKFRVWVVSKIGTIYKPVESNSITTKSLKDIPMPISAIDLLRYDYSWNESDYKATLSWNASTDRSCHHEFVWFGGDVDYTQLEVAIPYNFTITIDKLLFNSNYSVAVMTKNWDWSLESAKVWYHFTTPFCMDVLKSLEFCAPQRPTGVEAQEVLRLANDHSQVYDVDVAWDHPHVIPDWYLVHLNTFQVDQDETTSFVNVTGNSTNVVFKDVHLVVHYQIILVAYSRGGRSEPCEIYKQINATTVNVSSLQIGNNVFMLFVLPIGVILCVVLSLLFVYKEYYKREKLSKRKKYFEELELKSSYIDAQLSDETESEKFDEDEWEVEDSCLSLLSVLGRGAFGIVRKAYLQKDDKTIEVAVKMLLDHHRYSDVRDFKQEIEIMKSVGSHPHIVSLIGCCTKGKPRNLRLIVEYCAKGDLLTYLRRTWDEILHQTSQTKYENVDTTDCNNVDNKLYMMGVTETWNVQIKDLVSIGLQVCMGMEYLTSLHVLHRDLAARNILVCEDRSVKVSDFGLSRDVYRDDVYCKTSSGKLPIRWLALESLTHQMYTTHSDMWSYGILLWEIITLGGNPYPGVQTHELLDLLSKGYRMSRPSNCSPELFAIMMSCWNSNLKERPSFTQIRQLLENILECKSEYLNLNLCQSLETLDTTKESDLTMTSVSSERYVKAFAP